MIDWPTIAGNLVYKLLCDTRKKQFASQLSSLASPIDDDDNRKTRKTKTKKEEVKGNK